MSPPTVINEENMSEVMLALAAPFMDESVEWRQDSSRNGRVKLLAYLDWRAIQRRLDAVVGPWNWRTRVGPVESKTIGAIDIYITRNGVGEWVSREAVSTGRKMHGAQAEQHSVKAGATDAFKVAFVQWGGGRHLYELGQTWVPIVKDYPKSAPKCRVVNCGKDGWAVAPSIREVQAELFEQLPVQQIITAENYPDPRERRGRRIQLLLRRSTISKQRWPLAIEMCSARIRRHKTRVYWQRPGMPDLREMTTEHMKIASHTMLDFAERGLIHELLSEYEAWKADGCKPQQIPGEG